MNMITLCWLDLIIPTLLDVEKATLDGEDYHSLGKKTQGRHQENIWMLQITKKNGLWRKIDICKVFEVGWNM